MNNRRIKIRKVMIDDLEDLFKTGKTIFEALDKPQEWNPEQISDIFSGSMDLSFVAMSRKKISGFIIGGIVEGEDHARIYSIGVIPPLKNSGLDMDLFNFFLKEALQKGAKSIKTVFPADNVHLLSFFKKIGFTEKEQNITMRFDI